MTVRPPQLPLTDGIVTLRALRDDDRAAVLETMRDPLVQRWLNMPRQPGPRDFEALLRVIQGSWADGSRYDLVIADGDDAALGAVIASRRHRDNWELAYLIGAPGRGRGLATRAVRLVCDWLFAADVGRLEIRTHPGNDASQRVAAGAGFQREGLERGSIWLHGRRADALVWSLLPGDPR